MKTKENRISALFNVAFPIVQAGMVWCSGWRLASAVSNAGGLGLLGAGSMTPEVLQEHIQKTKAATSQTFGVNVPLLYKATAQIMNVIVSEGVKIVFTSAGNPAQWTGFLKDKGITVVHVTSSVKFARKAAQVGVDAVVAEGFEAGGHNGREETTTFVLTPMVRDAVGDLPLLAAGGIGSGRGMLAAEVLGADGVQIGSRFAATEESSAHASFKQRIVAASEGDTKLMMKKVTPVRLLKNRFFEQVAHAEAQGDSEETLRTLLGKGRARKGMFEGDMEEGELEIGQIASAINDIPSAVAVVKEIWKEYNTLKSAMCN